MTIDNKIQSVFDGFLNDPQITHGRLIFFGRDHRIRMFNNNPGGIYTDSIAATDSVLDNLDSIMGQKIIDKGTRKGGTSAKDDCRVLIEVYVADNIGFCRSKFGGKTNSRFIATFPQLMKSFYRTATIAFEKNVEALISKATTYESVLGAGFKNDLIALYHNYTVAGDTHDSQMVAFSNDIVTEQMAANVVADQIMDNLLLIARNNRGSKTAAKIYFNTTLLYPKKGTEIFEGKVPAQSRQDVCDIVYSPGKHTHIYITGAAALTFGMELDGLKVGNLFTGNPGDKLIEAFTDYFINGTKIYVLNESDVEGMYRMEIVP